MLASSDDILKRNPLRMSSKDVPKIWISSRYILKGCPLKDVQGMDILWRHPQRMSQGMDIL